MGKLGEITVELSARIHPKAKLFAQCKMDTIVDGRVTGTQTFVVQVGEIDVPKMTMTNEVTSNG